MRVRKQQVERKRARPASIRARRTAQILSEKRNLSVGKAMIEAGYSPITALRPTQLTATKAWKDLMEEYLPEEKIAKAHAALLNSHSVEHLVFPLETPELTDEHIVEMLAATNCTVRKIVRGEHARHIYFWSPDNRARKDALDMAYKLRGSYAAEKHLHGHVDFSLVGLGKVRDTTDTPVEAAPIGVPDIEMP